MNLKIESDRLDGANALENASLPPGRRTVDHGAVRTIQDSATISHLTIRVSEAISAEQARVEHRVSELAALYAKDAYQPNAAALSRAMISRALVSDPAGEL